MAIKIWLGAAKRTKQKGTFTIGGTPAAGNTVGVTINGKNVTYTVVAGDTTTLVATGLAAALRAADDGEFSLITWSSDAAVITAEAAEAGVPFTATGAGTVTTTATGGGATNTYAAVTANSSPNDVANTANWSGGALPGAADDVIVENTAEPMLWNLDALAAVSLTSFKVRDSFACESAGWIGNPTIHPTLGFREFRGTELSLQGCTTLEVNQNPSAPAGSFRFNVGAVQCALKVTGSGPSAVREECVEWRGTHAANAAEVYGGSLAVQPLIQSVSGTAVLATAKVISGTLRLEQGVTVSGSVTLMSGLLDTRVSIPTLTMDGEESAATVRDAASISTALTVDAGSVNYLSTGALVSLLVGSGASISFEGSEAAVVVGTGTAGSVTLEEGASYLDYNNRTVPFPDVDTLKLNRTGIDGVTLRFGPGIYLQPTPI